MAQLVARYLGVVEAARSSRVTQTRSSRWAFARRLLLICASLLERASDYRPAPQAQGGRVSKRKQSGGLFSRRDTPQRTRLKKRAGERHANGIRRGRAKRSDTPQSKKFRVRAAAPRTPNDYATGEGQRTFKHSVSAVSFPSSPSRFPKSTSSVASRHLPLKGKAWNTFIFTTSKSPF